MITALVGATVFIGDGRILDRATVVIEDARISKVGPRAAAPRGARKIDLTGQTLLPGLIDCHVHLCFDASPDPMTAAIRQRPALTAFQAAEMARRTLLGGVTTVRDMGSLGETVLGLKEALAKGLIQGPRIVASGQLICMTGGHGWPAGREADGPDEVRKAVRAELKAGAEVIKLMASGGVMTPGVDSVSAQFTEEELRAGVEEAHKAGRRTATHAQGTQAVLNALRAGIDSVEHGFFLDDECVELMVQGGRAYVPTISAVHFIVAHGRAAGIPEFAVAKAEAAQAAHRRSLALAKVAGVTIGMGTDAGTPFNLHGANLRELKLMVEVGLTPAEALVSATATAAKVLGLEKEIGTVEPGKLADLAACPGDPLAQIGRLAEPEAFSLILQGGRVVKAAPGLAG